MTRVFSCRTNVRYAETDASGIVYYANYFIYFELGRLEMFRQLDLPYDKGLPIVDTYCRYHASARFQDCLEIQSSIDEIRSKGFRVSHRVLRILEDAEPELLAEGYTAMVTANEQGRPIPIPPRFQRAFERLTHG